uniref:Uncharacterized protein n=1 Tax=Romanomermis culicivorax TaxID=13658 RepID=A0A915IIU1_ROMCU
MWKAKPKLRFGVHLSNMKSLNEQSADFVKGYDNPGNNLYLMLFQRSSSLNKQIQPIPLSILKQALIQKHCMKSPFHPLKQHQWVFFVLSLKKSMQLNAMEKIEIFYCITVKTYNAGYLPAHGFLRIILLPEADLNINRASDSVAANEEITRRISSDLSNVCMTNVIGCIVGCHFSKRTASCLTLCRDATSSSLFELLEFDVKFRQLTSEVVTPNLSNVMHIKIVGVAVKIVHNFVTANGQWAGRFRVDSFFDELEIHQFLKNKDDYHYIILLPYEILFNFMTMIS